jgi:hypothetical protein
MITKIENHEIEYQINIEIFLARNNIMEDKTKPIMKLNFQLTQYLKK